MLDPFAWAFTISHNSFSSDQNGVTGGELVLDDRFSLSKVFRPIFSKDRNKIRVCILKWDAHTCTKMTCARASQNKMLLQHPNIEIRFMQIMLRLSL